MRVAKLYIKRLKSITQELGSSDFYRLRVGIGKPVHKSDMLNWVLGRPASDDQPYILAAQEEALHVLEVFTKQGLEKAVSLARLTKPS